MEITSLKCNNCGANLEINPKIKFFTCTFCKSSLTIKKSGNVIFTEVLGGIKKDTETLIDNSEEMLVEKKIARLDREWEIEQKQFGVYLDDNFLNNPDEVNLSMVGSYVLLGIGWLIFISILGFIHNNGGVKAIMFIVGSLVVLFMGFSFFFEKERKENFLVARREYNEKRKILLSQSKK
ncbi:MAG: hypothetical protein AB8H03_01725 [Saprospiraceae bacterium]